MASAILLRRCLACKKKLPFASFPRSKTENDGYSQRCKACHVLWITENRSAIHRNARLKNKYGITQAIYDEMLAAQQGRCAICRKDKPGGTWNVFCVDHCHATGKIRGLLCTSCNVLLSSVGDNIDGLRRFVNYLQAGAPDRTISKRCRPCLKTLVRYIDAKGCRCTKDAPGAKAIRTKTESYYVKINGRWVALKTKDPVKANAILDGWRIASGQPPEQPKPPPPGIFSAF